MFCSKCGQTLADDAKTCLSCGAPVSGASSSGSGSSQGASGTSQGPGAMPPGSELIARLYPRVKAILTTPKTEWPVIADEGATSADIYLRYVAPLAAIGAIAGFIGSTVVGMSVPLVGTVRTGAGAALAAAIVAYVLTFVQVFVVALIVDVLAPTFGGQRDSLRALKVTAYSFTPGWVAAVLVIFPALGIIAGLIGLYGLYLLYLGLPVLMRSPPERSLGYTVVVVIAAIVVGIVIGIVVHAFGPHAPL
ncbi:MAG TPA: YIP1 family protein [Casimicrobiaceae bacterium]|nr:YIP1 family protein [Casimicrobiaceae bacterium]